MTEATDPRTTYVRRLKERRDVEGRLGRAERAISAGRGVVFVAGALCWWLAVGPRVITPWSVGLAAVVFLTLVVAHEMVLRAKRRASRAAELYERGLARLEDRWIGEGEDGAALLEPHHRFAEDLDLFGPGSVFQRIGAPRTRMGQETLGHWLCNPAEPDEVRARQSAVAELRGKLDLREDLALLGEQVLVGLSPQALRSWSAAPPVVFPRATRSAGAVLSGIGIATLLGWFAFDLGPGPFLLAAVALLAFSLMHHTRVRRVVGGVDRPGRDLSVLCEALRRVEAESFDAPRLVASRARLATDGLTPSQCIGRLSRLVDLLESRRNMFFAPFAGLLLWETQIALTIEAWRAVHGGSVGEWLKAVGELEALSSLASYAFENPEDPFPDLVEEGPLFDAQGLGHPLIPRAECVRNDLSLDSSLGALVVSGSNMSGKTTLLRTVGVNAVLAQAGAPVRATRLRLSALAVGASIRVHDSLQDHTSRFYAEIKRLRELMDLAGGQPPLLFLLDEVLHGTNSGDRRVGAGAVVRGLVERGAIGLVTTHDLALADVADSLAPRAGNVHFEDHLEQGRIAFDYRMRPGVVRKSNALALMRAVGLDV